MNLGAIGGGVTTNGTITTNIVQKTGSTATAVFNFHGGTLAASATPGAAFFTGLTDAYVYGEGGVINNSGQSIVIGQALLAPTGNGVNSLTLSGTTAGYTPGATPFVTISGGGGTGATAIANISTGGQLTLTLTNPGTGYTSVPTVTLTGITAGGMPIVTAAIGANTSGGLTFTGAGVTTLSAVETYTGQTAVNAGTLTLTGSLTGSSVVTNGTSVFSESSTGVVAGAASFTQGSSGTSTLAGANTYTGATNVNAGALDITGSGMLGASGSSALTMGGGMLDLGTTPQTVGAVSITAAAASGNTIQNGSLIGSSYAASNASGNAIVTANLLANGSAGLTMSGGGILTLAGTNTYTGATTINAGTLRINGSTSSSSAVAVNGGGTLGGTGTIGGAVTVAGGASSATQGSITLGNGLGTDTLTLTGGLTLGGSAGNSSSLNFQVAATSADMLAITGPLAVNAGERHDYDHQRGPQLQHDVYPGQFFRQRHVQWLCVYCRKRHVDRRFYAHKCEPRFRHHRHAGGHRGQWRVAGTSDHRRRRSGERLLDRRVWGDMEQHQRIQ